MVTYNPANPPFYTWIKSLIGTLHEDPELKVRCNKIPVVTRQPPSVASLAIKSRHWLDPTGPGPTQLPAGCHRQHAQRSCVCLARMDEVTTQVKSTHTDREYNIRRHYNCKSSWVIYVVTCEECKIQYTGQTRQTMAARHYGHRSEVKQGADGLGRHFKDVHGVGKDLTRKEDLAQCLESFKLQVIGSVRPPATPEEEPVCQARLDQLEADMPHRFRCMSEIGGKNLRDENTRKRRN